MIVRTAKLTATLADPSSARSHDERDLNATADINTALGLVTPVPDVPASSPIVQLKPH